MSNNDMNKQEYAYYNFIVYVMANNFNERISWTEPQEKLFRILNHSSFMMKTNNITFGRYLVIQRVDRRYISNCMRGLIEKILSYCIGVKSDFTGKKAKKIRRFTKECKAVLNDNN